MKFIEKLTKSNHQWGILCRSNAPLMQAKESFKELTQSPVSERSAMSGPCQMFWKVPLPLPTGRVNGFSWR